MCIFDHSAYLKSVLCLDKSKYLFTHSSITHTSVKKKKVGRKKKNTPLRVWIKE